LPYAPDAAYGTPDELKSLIDAAHGAGLMVFLDVVYNHFGPDGNYLHLYSPQFFTEQHHTAWGAAIDFRRSQVREFFLHNALYWLMEYRFDGLRFDAVHAIVDRSWLGEMAAQVRRRVEPGRRVHLMLENEFNEAGHLEGDFDAQWNDDIHNALHVILTGEYEGYYAHYQERPAALLARALAEGFIYQGQPVAGGDGHLRGTPSAHLPPTAFIFFLQNHDQVGNRALGERLSVLVPQAALEAAIALQLLTPQIPLLFMGEESGSRTPFFYFTSHHAELAEAVRDGRRREFAKFAAFSDANARESIPDPNDPATFESSRPRDDSDELRQAYEARYRDLLSLRRRHLMPRLPGTRCLGASAIGAAAVIAGWRLGDGAVLTIAANFGASAVTLPPLHAPVLHESRSEVGAALQRGQLLGQATCVLLEPAH
jgi:malto-oligosyltrehalose trehalohydrolase